MAAPQLISEHGKGGGFLKPTPSKTPAPTKTVLPVPPKTKRPSYTAAQEATMHAKALLQPQYNQASVEAQRQNQAIQAYTTAVMKQLAGVAPAIGQDYNNQINAQSGMVNAAADSLRAVNPSGDVAKLLAAVGAPAAQGQQIQGNLNNTFNGGAAVGQYVNGVSPLGALRSQGQAAETLARLQPGFTALGGRQALLSALQSQSDARAKIGEQAPALAQDWLNTFTANRAKNQQLALEQNALGLKTQKQSFDQNLSLTKLKQTQDKYISDYNLRVKEFNSKLDATAQKAALPNSSLSRAKGYLVDSRGNAILDSNGKRQILPGFNTNAQGRVVKAGKTKPTAVAPVFPNLTKTQVLHLRAGVAAAFNGVPAQKDASGKVVSPAHPPLSYWGAVNEAVKEGYSKAAAIKMANHFYMPGKRGRPRGKR